MLQVYGLQTDTLVLLSYTRYEPLLFYLPLNFNCLLIKHASTLTFAAQKL